ncbi:unnamed protein product [Strongylus vulgaris]|uniref:Uncharacterized protein n=1 Tax=Strongylus vulgaris TaxID=40348 RepID=A0A3P7IIG9_STRVU|nr:unnamed protein product [Strongylus vulgaris]
MNVSWLATTENTFNNVYDPLYGLDLGISPIKTEEEKELQIEASPLLIVLITMCGRMANVVGTMKLYKGLGKFFSDRKRKKFRKATERVQNGETEVEITEIFADCCQCF